MKKRALVVWVAGWILSGHAAIVQWSNPGTGEFGTATNWAGGSVPSPADVASFTNSGTATVAVGQSYTVGGLNLAVPGAGRAGSGTVSMSGGSLFVTGLTVVGYNGTGTGTLSVAGTGKFTGGGNLQVGNSTAGFLNVGSASTGSCTTLYIGLYTNGAGTVNLAGTWSATAVFFGNTGGAGTLNLTHNFKLTTTASVRTFRDDRPVNFNVYGSGGQVSVGTDFLYTNANASLSFIADDAGVTTVNVGGNINIAGSVLNINLDAYRGSSTNLVLMNGTTLSGTFAAVHFTGNRRGTVIYDTAAGDLRLVPDASGGLGLFVISSIGPLRMFEKK